MRAKAVTVSAASLACGLFLLSSGCKVAVNLETTPAKVIVHEPLIYDVSVTNTSNCPVGDVKALVFPLIPKDIFLDQLPDPPREDLRPLVDAFCTDKPLPPFEGSANCTREESALLCTIEGLLDGNALVAGDVPDPPSSDTEVTCAGGTGGVKCRIPSSMLGAATTAASTTSNGGALDCMKVDGPGPLGAVCTAETIGPGTTETGQFYLKPKDPGVFRNWTLVLAEKAFGVCSKGTSNPTPPNTPCQEQADCTGTLDACVPSICVAGTNLGYGCIFDSQCGTDGDCQSCGGDTSEESVLATVDCTTTQAFLPAKAPMLSGVALLATALALTGAGVVRLRRRARRL